MTKRLTDAEKRDDEEEHYKYNFTQDLKDLIDDVPMDGTAHVRVFPTWEEATRYRGEVYRILRGVRRYHFYKPWLGDKVWRVKVSVQGNELVLWVKPSRYFDESLRNSKTMAYNRQTVRKEEEPRQIEAMSELNNMIMDIVPTHVPEEQPAKEDPYENMGKK
jgi:hypothetical protein